MDSFRDAFVLLRTQLQSERLYIVIGRKGFFFNFPKAPLLRKQWIHAIRRDEGKDFVITERTKVCSLHFKSEDLRKSINGRIYVKEGGIPSKFDWSGPSPKKRKAPTERQPLPAKKKLLTEETVEMFAFEPSFEVYTCETQDVERQISEQTKQIGELEEKLKQSESDINNLRRENNEQSEKIGEQESEINNLRRENTELNEKLTDFERQQKEMSSRLFCVDRFTTDGDISFYTGTSVTLPESWANVFTIVSRIKIFKNGHKSRITGHTSVF